MSKIDHYALGAWAAWRWAIENVGQREIGRTINRQQAYICAAIAQYSAGRIALDFCYGDDRKQKLRHLLVKEFGDVPPPCPDLSMMPLRTKAYIAARQFDRREMLNRPLDMGGPRDVWLTYTVPPDPRLDAFIPVKVIGEPG